MTEEIIVEATPDTTVVTPEVAADVVTEEATPATEAEVVDEAAA